MWVCAYAYRTYVRTYVRMWQEGNVRYYSRNGDASFGWSVASQNIKDPCTSDANSMLRLRNNLPHWVLCSPSIAADLPRKETGMSTGGLSAN